MIHVEILKAKGRPGFRVDNKQEGYEIGYIEWSDDFKSGIFCPLESTVYTPDCLIEIAEFMKAQPPTDARRKE
jgi:hypothetical protein